MSTPPANAHIRIDADRMLARLEALAAIDRRDDGSCCRLALTESDRAGRDLLVGWMREAELDVRVDGIGNLFGLRAGRMPGSPIMIGSHIDTVATGGRYDGCYGVIAGLELLQRLHELHLVTDRPLVLAAFTNEEGVRYQPDMMGSLVHVGALSLSDALNVTGIDGTRLGDELVRIGYAGSERCGAIVPHAFVELHIEQGPVLDLEGGVLGAVENLQGISWQEVRIQGVSNHAGTTPMRLRKDAGVSAARIALFVRDLARRISPTQVATVGSVQLTPNLINVIPGQAVLTVDLRNTDEATLQRAEHELTAFLDLVAAEEGVVIETKLLVRTQPVIFDDKILAAIETAADSLGQPIRRMTSGAGHDAQMLAQICPSAMIFVPSVAGISHNPREYTSPEHLEIGANALLRTVLHLAAETDGTHA
jgi:N-carbamoyl-L-amino-acid hydrolase